jgi:hypothetical protein
MTSKSSELEMDIDTKQNIIVSQTSYTAEYARELLDNNNGDYVKIILEYLKKDARIVDMKETKQPSINQSIYKHIRNKMNENMDEVISRMNGNL